MKDYFRHQNQMFSTIVYRMLLRISPQILFLSRTVLINAYSTCIMKIFFLICSCEHGKVPSSSADCLTAELCLLPPVAKFHVQSTCPVSLKGEQGQEHVSRAVTLFAKLINCACAAWAKLAAFYCRPDFSCSGKSHNL